MALTVRTLNQSSALKLKTSLNLDLARPRRTAMVHKFSRLMKEKKWIPGSNPIKISRAGRLIDGGIVLDAIIMTPGVKVPVIIETDASEKQVYNNTEVLRWSKSHLPNIKNKKYAGILVKACPMVANYDAGRGLNLGYPYSGLEVEEMVNSTYPEMQEVVVFTNKRFRHLMPSHVAAAIFYILWRDLRGKKLRRNLIGYNKPFTPTKALEEVKAFFLDFEQSLGVNTPTEHAKLLLTAWKAEAVHSRRTHHIVGCMLKTWTLRTRTVVKESDVAMTADEKMPPVRP